jgi:hypothetical protein
MSGTGPETTRTPRSRRAKVGGLTLLVALVVFAPTALEAQGFFSRYGESSRSRPIREGLPDLPGGFTFCRLWYTQVRRERGGMGWSTDYPRADRNLTLRLSELTLTPVSRWFDGEPGIAGMRATDPELYRCPFLFASDAGTAGFDPSETEALREYLLKGGFLWVDDFWGDRALAHFTGEMARVLPEYDVVDLPMEHPLYSIVYQVPEIPQITALQFWYPGASTSERGEESAVPHIYGMLDEDGRILVLMSHNTDLADGWEREGDNAAFFDAFSPDAYAIGINVAVWIMTH